MTIFQNKIESLIEKLEELPVLADIVADQEMATQFPEKVRHQIKEEGEDSTGQIIQYGDSESWGAVRSMAGLQIEYVDLYYTGTFLNNLNTAKTGEDYFLESSVSYMDELKFRYPDILGLQDDNLQLIIDDIKKKLIKELKDGR